MTIVEKDRIGGMLREIEFENGTHCDSAPHILFFDETDSPTRELFEEHADLQQLDAYAKTYPRGDLDDPHDYPVTRTNAELWDDTSAIYRELDRDSDDDGETFDEFVKQQVGDRLYERYFESYTEKQWGVEPTQITGDWFGYKISFPETERPFFGDDFGYYPDRKYVTILRELVENCSVTFEGATGLRTEGDRVRAVETDSGSRIDGDVFVSTVDPTYLVPGDANIRYRSMVIVAVRSSLDTEALFPSHVDWGYFPNHYEFTRMTDYEFTPLDFGEETVLTFEFPCFVGDNVWTKDDEWFRNRVETFFADQGIDADLREVVLRRLPRAYPLPVEDDIAAFESVNRQLSSYDNLYNLGRVSTYQYIWIKDIVDEAVETATRIERDLEGAST